MDSLEQILSRARDTAKALTRDELAMLLSVTRDDELAMIFASARDVKNRVCGRGIAIRGLIESSNICSKDCFYCGIRKSLANVSRYSLSKEEIYESAQLAKNLGYASIVIQSGEIESEKHTRDIEETLAMLRPLNLGITLSLGEQTKEVYSRWHAAGASRYLLRIETSNRELYSRLHPSTCSWSRRDKCLDDLREVGYQVGTGVMCALPSQTYRDLANDIIYFANRDVDMIGMGPYVPHIATPLQGHIASKEERLLLGLKMIAITRLYLHDINIASATALEALASDGRIKGILAGANVVMPNVTNFEHRRDYKLYDDKPAIDESALAMRDKLATQLATIDEKILLDIRGDSKHFAKRNSTL